MDGTILKKILKKNPEKNPAGSVPWPTVPGDTVINPAAQRALKGNPAGPARRIIESAGILKESSRICEGIAKESFTAA